MSGFDALKALKIIDQTRDIPVMIISTNTLPSMQVKALHSGAVDLIAKPFDRQLLLNKAKTFIQLRRDAREIRHMHNELLASHAELMVYKPAIDSVPDAVVISSPTGTIQYFNRAFLKLTGESAETPLTAREQEMLRNRSKSTCQMIERIPRLEEITQMIALQDREITAGPNRDCAHTGASLLTVCGQFDQLLTNGLSHRQVMNRLAETLAPNASDILQILEQVEPLILDTTIMHIDVEYLRVGMVLAEDIRTQSNIMIIKKGQIVTALMKERLRNFIQQNTLKDKVRVYESQKM